MGKNWGTEPMKVGERAYYEVKGTRMGEWVFESQTDPFTIVECDSLIYSKKFIIVQFFIWKHTKICRLVKITS